MLSKLASSIKIETFDDLLEAASDWGYKSKYGHKVLLLLKNVDHEQQRESRAQHVKTMRANKKTQVRRPREGRKTAGHGRIYVL